jgi:hypothetical protein
MKSNTIDLKTCKVTLREDGIMYVHIKDNTEMELQDAAKLIEAIGKLGNNEKYPILVDCGEFAAVDKEARLLFANKESNIFSLADAVAYRSLAHKLFADFYVKHYKPQVPTKIFPDKESAVNWLKRFL